MSLKLTGRLRFFLVLATTAILNYIVGTVIFFFENSTLITNVLFYILRSLTTLMSVSLSLFFIDKFLPEKKSASKSESLTLERKNNSIEDISLFKAFSFKNFLSQLKIALILLSCVYIPLDFLSYLIPGVLDYSANSFGALDSRDPTNYFLYDFPLMLLISLIIHFNVALREEFLYRNTFLTVGERDLKKNTAFIYSSLLFALAHFSYIFTAENEGLSPFFPIWWAFNALIIGSVSGYYFTKKKLIWPIIFAHWINNFISSIVLRNYILEKTFWKMSFLYLYLPFLIIGIIVIVLSIKNNKLIYHFKQFAKFFKGYKEENSDKNSDENSLVAYIFIDFVLIIFLWFVTLML